MSKPQPVVRRESEVSLLAERLRDTREHFQILGLNGPGGIGKSFLFQLVREAIDLDALGYITLTVDAANAQARDDFFGTLEVLFPRRLASPASSTRDHFPRLREAAAIHRKLLTEASAEIDKKGAPPDVKKVATLLLKTAKGLNAATGRQHLALDLVSHVVSEDHVEATVDAAWDLVRNLDALAESAPTWMPRPLRELAGGSRRSRVRNELYRFVAEGIRKDLAAALEDTERARVLIVIDDYEAFTNLLGEFLVGALVPELQQASFSTVLCLIGRDAVEATHPGWSQHCKRYLSQQIELAPFGDAEALELLRDAGVPEERRRALYEATQGFPFLLSLVIEEATTSAADSALFLKRFFDRTTRWMTPTERDWFVRVCYLDVINLDTLARVFPAADLERVQDWFEQEPSVRDPAARVFRVRPLIRDKVLHYQAIRAPSRHEELLRAARGASE